MKPQALAKRYAHALFELAEERGLAEEILMQFKEVGTILSTEPRVKAYLLSPRVDKKLKIRTLEKLFKGKVADLFFYFMVLLVQKGRQGLFVDILRQYALFCDNKAKRIRARVISAVALDRQNLLSLQEILSRQLEANVICENEVDTDLMGGLIVEANGKVIDGSLRRQLQRLREQMLQTKFFETR